jgi:hypothetical protein
MVARGLLAHSAPARTRPLPRLGSRKIRAHRGRVVAQMMTFVHFDLMAMHDSWTNKIR